MTERNGSIVRWFLGFFAAATVGLLGFGVRDHVARVDRGATVQTTLVERTSVLEAQLPEIRARLERIEQKLDRALR